MGSFFIGLDDLLHKAMTHNVLFREVALRNAVHILEHMQCVYKAAACSLRQVDLGHITGDHDLGTTPMRVRNIFICSGVVFCASSRIIKESSSVRPRI